jgi:hypothetical protein
MSLFIDFKTEQAPISINTSYTERPDICKCTITIYLLEGASLSLRVFHRINRLSYCDLRFEKDGG